MRKSIIALLALGAFCAAAVAGDFNWKQQSGKSINVLLVQHPYGEGITTKLAEFEAATGIKVNISIIPEENYFDKLTTSLSSHSGDPDVYMTGAYQVWEYAPPGYMVDLSTFIEDPGKTAPDYNFADFYDGIVGALRWDLVPGHKVGVGPQWALPLGFETNCLSYNKEVLDKFGVAVPKTMDELLAAATKLNKFEGEGTYGIALRGTRNWATIHPGYMTAFTNYGAQDLAIEGGKLVSKVNAPEAVAMTDAWVKLIKAGGSPTWASYTWYQCGADLGARKAAIMFDADILGYFNDFPDASNQSGKLGSAPPPLPAGKTKINANLWVWSIAMNADSKAKDAAWLFIQYFTSRPYQFWSVTDWKAVDPPRKSVFEDPKFQAVVGEFDGFLDMFAKTVPGTTICFTPNPYFFELTTEWAATLQDLVAGNYPSTQAAMDALKVKMDRALEDVELE
ncbi:MAG: sugar ABC transporter substrate-binding protein [Planctomycetota bacterium]|jgi:multiple sugar transport system substrate-binding protein|nr:sugar ABC transporter substrate-binding protein [Planctomycetota bacterium]